MLRLMVMRSKVLDDASQLIGRFSHKTRIDIGATFSNQLLNFGSQVVYLFESQRDPVLLFRDPAPGMIECAGSEIRCQERNRG